jgi:hypothetical protein
MFKDTEFNKELIPLAQLARSIKSSRVEHIIQVPDQIIGIFT